MNDLDLFGEFVRSNRRGQRHDRAALDPQVVIELDRYLGRARASVTSITKAMPTLPPIYTDWGCEVITL